MPVLIESSPVVSETAGYASSERGPAVAFLLDRLKLNLRFKYLSVFFNLVVFLHFLDFKPILIVFLHFVTLTHLPLMRILVELLHHPLFLQLPIERPLPLLSHGGPAVPLGPFPGLLLPLKLFIPLIDQLTHLPLPLHGRALHRVLVLHLPLQHQIRLVLQPVPVRSNVAQLLLRVVLNVLDVLSLSLLVLAAHLGVLLLLELHALIELLPVVVPLVPVHDLFQFEGALGLGQTVSFLQLLLLFLKN